MHVYERQLSDLFKLFMKGVPRTDSSPLSEIAPAVLLPLQPLPSRPTLATASSSEMAPEASAGLWSQLTFSWMNPLIHAG